MCEYLPWSRSSEQVLVFVHECYSIKCFFFFISRLLWILLANLPSRRSGNLVPQLRRFECYCPCWLSSGGGKTSFIFELLLVSLDPIGCAWYHTGAIVRELLRGQLPERIRSSECSSIYAFLLRSWLLVGECRRFPSCLYLILLLYLCFFFAFCRFNVPNHCKSVK